MKFIKNVCSKLKWQLTIILTVFISFFSSCGDRFTSDDHTRFYEFLFNGCVSLDGNFKIYLNQYAVSPSSPKDYSIIWHNNAYYHSIWNRFAGATDSKGKPQAEVQMLDEEVKDNRDLIITLLQFHNESEMTVSVKGAINIPSIRLKKGSVPGTPEVHSYGHQGFKGMINENVDAHGVTADGLSQLRFVFDANAYNVISVEAVFYDGDKNIINDDRYTGTISEPKFVKIGDEQKWYVIYTAPKEYSLSKTPQSLNLKVTMMSDDQKFIRTFSLDNFVIERCGIGLVHGLWSDAESCFGGLRDYLVDVRKFYRGGIVMIDYESNNSKAFDVNQYISPIVDKNLGSLYDNFLERGIVSSSYDLVGHSMGGILSRLYAQKTNPSAVHKIITLDTPHYGSQLADAGSGLIKRVIDALSSSNSVYAVNASVLLDTYYNTQQRALVDLKTTSRAIEELNDESRLDIIGTTGVHAICSVMTNNDWTQTRGLLSNACLDVKRSIYEQDKFASLVISFETSVFRKDCDQWVTLNQLYEESQHDGIVSLTSQQGGLRDEYVTIEEAQFIGFLGKDSQAHHINTNKWEISYNNIGNLLEASVKESGLFSLGGFPNIMKKSYSTRSKQNDYLNSYTLVENDGAKQISITGNLEQGGKYLKINIDTGEEIVSAMLLANINGVDDALWISSGSKSYKLDLDGTQGDLNLYIIGRTENNEIVLAMTTFKCK